VSFNAYIQEFLNGCRPFISTDECRIKSHFRGQILTVIVKNGNNNFFSLALVVVAIKIEAFGFGSCIHYLTALDHGRQTVGLSWMINKR
jgi:hypothetical protein